MWFSSPGRGKSLSWFFKRLVAACAPVLMTSTTKKNNFSFILVGRQANENLSYRAPGMQSRHRQNWSKVLVCCTFHQEQHLHSSPGYNPHSSASTLSHIDPHKLPTDQASSWHRVPPGKNS